MNLDQQSDASRTQSSQSCHVCQAGGRRATTTCAGIARRRTTARRGMAVIGFVIALLVIGSFALWLFQLNAASSRSTLSHFYSTGAFYAAESGLEMALRELNLGNDIDSDGTNGTISDNDDPTDDPSVATGAFFVERDDDDPKLYRAVGRPVLSGAPWSSYRRVIEIRLE